MRKFTVTISRREEMPLGEIWIEKFTDWVRPMESQKSFAAISWVVEEVPTPG